MQHSLDETYANMNPKKAYYADQAQCAPAPSALYGDTSEKSEPFTLRGEAERKVGFHRNQAEKADQAAAFFRENPAFDEFIRLIRSGAIEI